VYLTQDADDYRPGNDTDKEHVTTQDVYKENFFTRKPFLGVIINKN